MTRPHAVGAAIFILLTILTLPQPVGGGSFSFVAICTDTDGCEPGIPQSNPSQPIPPFAITHPLGYEREGGKIEIPVCVDDDDPSLIPPTQRAIDTWNALTATTQNCLGCRVWEEPLASPDEPFHAESVILHELGHCAMGLGHINMPFDEDDDGMHEPGSFTRSSKTTSIVIGPDGLRGSFDDEHFEPPPPPANRADSVSWFRKADNDPVIVDGTVIELDTYSRSIVLNLPSGHTWGASANRVVAESLGEPFTQAVMYSLADPGQQYSGLSADEVNMVKMGMTGEDEEAGTMDDYTVELVYVEDCAASPSAIRVRFFALDPDTMGAAECRGTDIDYAFPPADPQQPVHFELVERIQTFPPQIRLDSALCWDTGPPIAPVVFMDGFESGDLSAWDDVVPFTTERGSTAMASWQPGGSQAASAQPTLTRGQDAGRTNGGSGSDPGRGRAWTASAASRSEGQRAGTCPPLR